MPAAYAHHKFGEECLKVMPDKLNKICTTYREIFDFGVHGPDLLFYYYPFKSNEVIRHGQELHTWSGEQFFTVCNYFYHEAASGNSAYRHAMLAYLLGFLAHFTLDSSCHAYINEMSETPGLTHNLIEAQYDAFLMKEDGKNPLMVDRSNPLKPSMRNASVVAPFFPFNEEKILKCMKGQKQVLHLLYSPKEYKKNLGRKAIDLLQIKGDFGDLFVDRTEIPDCASVIQYIYSCQEKAIDLYPELLQNLLGFLYDKNELNSYFKYDFEGILHE